jgi:hypothetical protein
MIILVHRTSIIPILFSYLKYCFYLHITVTTHEVPSSIRTLWHKNLIIRKVSYCENKKNSHWLKKKVYTKFHSSWPIRIYEILVPTKVNFLRIQFLCFKAVTEHWLLKVRRWQNVLLSVIFLNSNLKYEERALLNETPDSYVTLPT